MLGRGYFLHYVLLTLFGSFLQIHCEETLSELRMELKETQDKMRKIEELLNEQHHPSKSLCKYIIHGHCHLIHGSSVFFVYILDSPLP